MRRLRYFQRLCAPRRYSFGISSWFGVEEISTIYTIKTSFRVDENGNTFFFAQLRQPRGANGSHAMHFLPQTYSFSGAIRQMESL